MAPRGEDWKRFCTPEQLIERQKLVVWTKEQHFPSALGVRFDQEELYSIDQVSQLTSADIDKLCVGFTIGLKTRLKVFVKSSRKPAIGLDALPP